MSIRIRNSFLITAPAEQAWTVLNDIERVASCVPGAKLIEIAGDNIYKGRIAVRLGPVLAGTRIAFARLITADKGFRSECLSRGPAADTRCRFR
jgi:uncharacterized protein